MTVTSSRYKEQKKKKGYKEPASNFFLFYFICMAGVAKEFWKVGFCPAVGHKIGYEKN